MVKARNTPTSNKRNAKKAAKLRSPAESTPVSLWRRLLRATPFIIIFSLLTFLLEYGGWFRSFETRVLDTWLRMKLNWTSGVVQQPSNITIVAITDEDYSDRALFEGRSPLDAAKVQQLITAVLAGKPKVIGVDVDTSSWPESPLFQLPESPPIVWERNIERNEDVDLLSALPGREPSGLLHWGIARMPRDSDKMIRRYRRFYDTYQGVAPSFPLAVAHVARNFPLDENALSAIKEKEWDLNFLGYPDRFVQVYASEVLKAYTTLKANKDQDHTAQDKLNQLNNRIVLLGGFYEAGRDMHDTPLGRWAGVQLMAQAIETEIKGGHPLPNEAWVIFLGIVGSIVLVLLHHRLGWKWALPISLFAIVILAPLFSYFTTSTMAHWLYFFPILLAVWMRELYEHFRECTKARIRHLHDHL